VVLEIALIPIASERSKEFEAVVAASLVDLFPLSPGFIRGELRKGVEQSDTYALLLEWRAIEDHTETFVNSPLFARWMQLTEGMESGDASVLHWESID
jgi:heme-degrading monooxygenase HmoA